LNGGLDMAVAQHYGAEVAWHCEFDKNVSKILDTHFPDVPNFGDITAVDWGVVAKEAPRGVHDGSA